MNFPESPSDKDVWFESSTESQPHASSSPDTPDAGPATQRGPQLPLPPARRRRVKLPMILFILTCFSTFWVGANIWDPTSFAIQAVQDGTLLPIRRTLIAHWQDGLI